MSKRNFIVVMLLCLTICMAACSQKTENVSSSVSHERLSQPEPSSVENTISEESSELKSQSESVSSSESVSEESSKNSDTSQVLSQSSEEIVEVISNPTPDNFQGDDFFIYQKIACINATNIDWVNELDLTEGELLGEIKRTGIADNQIDWDATILPVGTKIYQHSEQYDVLIAIKGDTKIPYMKMIEG